ncbi:MAG: iron ABC transporter permease [Pseudomonadota bacterium]|nr:iron ABC transporter permease [Pseudomonadota bacterium]
MKLIAKPNYWGTSIAFLSIIIFFPIVALVGVSFGDSDGIWEHLFQTVLLRYIVTTTSLMGGVVILALLFGITTAWIVTNYDFPTKNLIDFILILPASCPAYLVAYAYTDFFEYAGPLQVGLRSITGWETASEYYFPEIRSVGGAIFVLASVLYPYIYLLARTAFLNTPESLIEVTSIYGKSKFWNVSLPLGRPAIMAGVALVSMEVVSDFGTVEYFSIQTLTLGIFNVWIGMNNLTAASQISLFTFLFIFVLLITEIKSRSNRRFNDTSRRQRNPKTQKVSTKKCLVLIAICLIPVLCGFFIPVMILIGNVGAFFKMSDLSEIFLILRNTVFVCLIGAIIIVAVSTFLATVAFAHGNIILQRLANIAASGYAFPGTMLAIGVLISAGLVDKLIAYLFSFDFIFFEPTYISGTLTVLIFAYLVRYLAVGYGATMSGLTRVSPNLSWASRTLSNKFSTTVMKVSIPLIKKSIVAGGLLAFVDIAKELPMTLLLRPFNFETLATYTYQFAHDELMDQASLPALIIIMFGLLPVILLNKLLRN